MKTKTEVDSDCYFYFDLTTTGRDRRPNHGVASQTREDRVARRRHQLQRALPVGDAVIRHVHPRSHHEEVGRQSLQQRRPAVRGEDDLADAVGSHSRLELVVDGASRRPRDVFGVCVCLAQRGRGDEQSRRFSVESWERRGVRVRRPPAAVGCTHGDDDRELSAVGAWNSGRGRGGTVREDFGTLREPIVSAGC